MKTLTEFLKSKRVLTKFKKNTYDQRKEYVTKDKLSDYINNNGEVASCFTWAYTPEGHLFWEDINNQHLAEIRK